jgi:hypothetical protein
MKRRKKPILLVTLLVVLLGAVVVMSMPAGGIVVNPGHGDVTGKGGEAPSASTVASAIKTHTAPTPIKAPTAPETGPSIAVHSDEIGYKKPKYVPGGTTSSQWYKR